MDICEESQEIIDWMIPRGPIDWHRVADSFNWDCDLAPLIWIAKQPDCDRGTAVTMFNLSEPHVILPELSAMRAGEVLNYLPEEELVALLETLIAGAEAGYYSTRTFRVGESAESMIRSIQESLRHPHFADRDWDIPEIFFDTVSDGLVVDSTGFEEGTPPEVFEAYCRRMGY